MGYKLGQRVQCDQNDQDKSDNQGSMLHIYELKKVLKHQMYMECLSEGPREGSYSPDKVGWSKESNKIGLVICFTDSLRISSDV